MRDADPCWNLGRLRRLYGQDYDRDEEARNMIRRGVFIAFAAALTIGGSPAHARELVPFHGTVQPGTIVVKTTERRLYLVLDDGRAIRYPVAVGRLGKQWRGETQVSAKFVAPAWTPPRRRGPTTPICPT